MKILNAIIYSLPIENIDTVYLVGKNPDYYKLYLEQKDNCIIKINLNNTLEKNFNRFNIVQKVHKGELTQKLSAKQTLKLLESCNWKNELGSDLNTYKIAKELLNIGNFKSLKNEIDKNLPFFFWIKKQENREDLVGDLAYEIKNDSKIGVFKTYNELESYISFNQTNHWEINSFRDSKKKSGSVSPLLCLKLAKMEYDIKRKKERLKDFRIPITKGYVYFLKPEYEKGPIKIGRARNIKQRVSQLQTSLPYDLKLVGYIYTLNYIELENEIHQIHNNKNIKREWFNIELIEVEKIIKNYNGIVIE